MPQLKHETETQPIELFINNYVHITITILILASCLCSVVAVPQVLTCLANLTQSTT